MAEPTAAPEVREATGDDWAAVAGLLEELGRPPVLDTPGAEAERLRFLAYLARGDTVALVAEAGGRVVGFLDLELRARLHFDTPQAWIPDLVVTASHRGRGTGRALLARAEAVARERGCWGMALESAEWRTEAHAFYRAAGWTQSGRSFVKLLADRHWPPLPPPASTGAPA